MKREMQLKYFDGFVINLPKNDCKQLLSNNDLICLIIHVWLKKSLLTQYSIVQLYVRVYLSIYQLIQNSPIIRMCVNIHS